MPARAMQVERVSKRFRVRPAQRSWLGRLAAALRAVPYNDTTKRDSSFWALRDVSFAADSGEALGVIGPNGAGKSTALKLLARILHPDRGNIGVRGRLTALIEVGAGFHGDLTGRENIYLNGAILGMRGAEIAQKLDDIVDFAGLGRFLDVPVKRYSSGMHARLGFSVAAHVDPDVLLVDEVLSVGDAAFRLRCLERMQGLLDRGTSLILVTHNLEQMTSICRRAVVLDAGAVAFDGPACDAVARYLHAVSQSLATRPTDVTLEGTGNDGPAEIVALTLRDDQGRELLCTSPGRPLKIELTFRLPHPVERLVVELNLRTAAQEPVLSFNSGRTGRFVSARAGENRATLSLPTVPLAGGQYFWNVRLWDMATGVTLADSPMRFPMLVSDDGKATGRLALEHTWDFRPFHESQPADSVLLSAPWNRTAKTGTIGRERNTTGPAAPGTDSENGSRLTTVACPVDAVPVRSTKPEIEPAKGNPSHGGTKMERP